MALIKCKECGNEFSEFADECPFCGCPTEIAKGGDASSNVEAYDYYDGSTGEKDKKHGLLGSALNLAAKGLKDAADIAEDISENGENSEYVRKAKKFADSAAEKTTSFAKKVTDEISEIIDDEDDNNAKSVERFSRKEKETRKPKVDQPVIIPVSEEQSEELDAEFVEVEATSEPEESACFTPVSDKNNGGKKKPRKGLIIAGVAVAIVLLLGIIGISGDSSFAMPDLSGMDASTAVTTLEDEGVADDVISYIDVDGDYVSASKVNEDWTITEQNPAKDEKVVPEEADITLTVSNADYEAEKAQKAKEEAEKKKKEEEARKAKEAQEKAEREALLQEEKKIKALKGGRISDSYNVTDELGYKFTYTHSYTEMDFTEAIAYERDPYKDWLIISVGSVNAKSKTAELFVNDEENQKRLESKEEAKSKLQSKLPKEDAFIAMEQYGKNKYPKFNLKWMGNEIAAEAKDSDTWFLKTYCTYTDAYGTKWKNKICEAEVKGTSDNPKVQYLYIYQ